MPKRRNLSIEERAAVVTLSKEKYTGRAIARRLKISLCAVQKILKKVCETGTVKDRPRSGRPSSTTPRQDRLLCNLSLSDRTATSRDLKRELEDATGSQISCRTIRRKLLKCGLKGCIAARKPLRRYLNGANSERTGRQNSGRKYYSQTSPFLSSFLVDVHL